MIKIGQDRKKVEEGVYPARISSIVELGTQRVTDFNKNQVEQQRIMVTFELPTETQEYDGEELPMLMSKEYTVSFGKKSNLGRLVKAVPKKDVKTLDQLLGQPVAVEIGFTSSGNNKITSVNPLLKGMQVPVLKSKKYYYEFLSKDNWDRLPTWMKDKVREAVDYDNSLEDEEGAPEVDEDAPNF